MFKRSIIRDAMSFYKLGFIDIKSLDKDEIRAVLSRGATTKDINLNVHLSLNELRKLADHQVSELLAILIQLLFLKNSSLKKKKYKKLLSQSNCHDELPFDLSSLPFFHKDSADFFLQSYKNLELYFVLSDKIRFLEKHGVSTDTYVEHLLKIYGFSDAHIISEAMEAMVRRIKSSSNENLKVLSRPPQKNLLGEYKVSSSQEESAPYRVTLISSEGIDGSCDCPDFERNALRFCKHLSCIYSYLAARPRLQKQFQRETKKLEPIFRFIPPIQYEAEINPLRGVYFVGEDSDLSPQTLKKIKSLFVWNSSTGCHALRKRKSLPDLIVHLDELEKYLKICEKKKTIHVDPALKRVLRNNLNMFKFENKLQPYKGKFQKTISAQKVKLFPYQREGTLCALSKGRFLLADDMGLGKTIQGISWGDALLKSKLAKKIMVICPASLKHQWQREWRKTTGDTPTIIDGHATDRENLYSSQGSVFILNYELIRRDLHLIKKMDLDAVILDEAQRIKNFATQTARNVKQLTPPFRLILTGTPFENRISELASLMDWINHQALGPHWRLLPETSYRATGVGGEEITGVKNLDLLRKRIAPFFLRRTRDKILHDLPQRIDSPVILPITQPQVDVHNDLKYRVARLMSIAEKRPLRPEEHLVLMALLTKMRIASNGMALYEFDLMWPSLKNDSPAHRLHQIHTPKLSEFRNIISSLLQQNGVKIVIFSQWVKMLSLAHWSIQDLLEDVRAVFFTGKQSQKKRSENIICFHDDPETRLFFATDAGGVGLNLQKAANVCINLDLPWNPAVLEQRVSRIHRLGQKKPVQIYNLITEDSIESRIFDLIEQKKQVFKGLFDSGTNEVIFDSSKSFFSQVKKITGDVNEEILKALNPTEGDDSDYESPLPVESAEVVEAPFVEEEEGSDTLPPPKIAPHEKPQYVPPEVSLGNDAVAHLLSGLQVERSQEGEVLIKAKGESAKLLAGVLKTLGTLLETGDSALPPLALGASHELNQNRERKVTKPSPEVIQ